MERYAAGLRWGTADALAALYTSDGVFIRDDLPAAAGRKPCARHTGRCSPA